jgi:diguanylate cyclase (GGDEF)-like protein
MKYKNIIIFLILIVIVNVIVFLDFNKMQIVNLYKSANNIHITVDTKINNILNSIEYLQFTATQNIKNRNNFKLKKSLLVQKIGEKDKFELKEIASKSPVLSAEGNLLGCGKFFDKKDTLQEMEAALSLTPYFRLVYKEHKNAAWVYYYSKRHFTVLYPYISGKDFQFNKALEKLPFYQYATPKRNPDANLFFTPLYMDAIGKGLILTIGKPVYDGKTFMGTIDLDVTLNHVDNLLSKLDSLNNTSFIYNKKLQIVGSNNLIMNFDRNKIYKASNFVSRNILLARDTNGNIDYIDGKYVFIKILSNTPFKLVYFQDAYLIWLKSFLYMLPLFFTMILLMVVTYLYRKSNRDMKKFEEQSIRDYMTGAYNRRYFFEVTQKLLLKSKRKEKSVAIVMTDIDDFKYVNDTYGHSAGDLAIIQMKEIFEKNLRESDIFARFGGEEFCLFLDDISKKDVENLFEKIRKEFEVNVIISGYHKFSYTVSFGIAYGVLDSVEEMIQLADKALYKSKENGKNIVTTYTTFTS